MAFDRILGRIGRILTNRLMKRSINKAIDVAARRGGGAAPSASAGRNPKAAGQAKAQAQAQAQARQAVKRARKAAQLARRTSR